MTRPMHLKSWHFAVGTRIVAAAARWHSRRTAPYVCFRARTATRWTDESSVHPSRCSLLWTAVVGMRVFWGFIICDIQSKCANSTQTERDSSAPGRMTDSGAMTISLGLTRVGGIQCQHGLPLLIEAAWPLNHLVRLNRGCRRVTLPRSMNTSCMRTCADMTCYPYLGG